MLSRLLRVFSLALSLIGCGGFAATTSHARIEYKNNADEWNDLSVLLGLIEDGLIQEYGVGTAYMIMDVTVYVFPKNGETHQYYNETVATPGKIVTGIYLPLTAEILLFRFQEEDKIFDTVTHEIFQHRLPHVLVGDYNPSHTQEWEDYDTAQNHILRGMMGYD